MAKLYVSLTQKNGNARAIVNIHDVTAVEWTGDKTRIHLPGSTIDIYMSYEDVVKALLKKTYHV